MPPEFSVVIPTWKRPDMLARALLSASGQIGPSSEIIVADDGDGEGIEVVQRLGTIDISGFRTGGLGQVPARNMAVRRARGRYIAFLDDDDWWASTDHLAGMKAALERGEFAYASGRIVRENAGRGLESWLPFEAHVDAGSIRRDNTLLVSGIAYAASLHKRLGALDETFQVYWDWDWYLRLAAAKTRFVGTGHDGVRISARVDTVSASANEALRRTELARLCLKHDLVGVTLKNHESIAVDQQRFNGPGTP